MTTQNKRGPKSELPCGGGAGVRSTQKKKKRTGEEGDGQREGVSQRGKKQGDLKRNVRQKMFPSKGKGWPGPK